jgi:hypothetical protein
MQVVAFMALHARFSRLATHDAVLSCTQSEDLGACTMRHALMMWWHGTHPTSPTTEYKEQNANMIVRNNPSVVCMCVCICI